MPPSLRPTARFTFNFALLTIFAFFLVACGAAPTASAPTQVVTTPLATDALTTELHVTTDPNITPSRTLQPTFTPRPTTTPRGPTATRIPSATRGSPTATRPPTNTSPPSLTPVLAHTRAPNVVSANAPVQAGTAVPQPVQAIGLGNAAQVSELARWGRGHVAAIAYSPDGRYVRVVTDVDTYFYDTQNWQGVATDVAQAMFADPNALGWQQRSEDELLIIHASDKALVSILPTYARQVVFSPDKQLVATALEWSEITVWQVATGRKLYTLELAASQGQDSCNGGSTTMAFAPDSTWLAAGSVEMGCGFVWDMADGKLVQYVNPQDWVVFGVGLSPTKDLLVTVETGGGIKVWQLPAGRLLATHRDSSLPWVFESPAAVAFAPDGKTFTVGLYNGEVLVYATDGGLLARLQSPTPTGEGLSFSANGQWLAVGAWDSVQVWRTDMGLRVRHNPTPTPRPALVNVAYAFAPPAQPLPRSGPSGLVMDVAIAPDGATVLAAFGNDERSNLALWQITDHGLDSQPLPAPLRDGFWYQLAFAPDGQWLAASTAQALAVYAVKGWHNTFNGALQGEIVTMAFAPQANVLAVMDNANHLGVITVTEQSQFLPWAVPNATLWAVALAPTGNPLALSYGDSFALYSNQVPQYRANLFAPDDAAHAVAALAFSPNGQVLATANTNGVINLWRASDGQPLQTLVGHQQRVLELTFSADGRFLASTSLDGTVRLWGVWP